MADCCTIHRHLRSHQTQVSQDLLAKDLLGNNTGEVCLSRNSESTFLLIVCRDRTPSASRSAWDWIHTLKVVPDKFTLYHQSLDSYLFLRFMRTLIFLCIVGCCITWPILMPINATGGGTSLELDRISIGNVAEKKKLYAHAVIAWVFFSFVMFTVARERLWLIGLRQAWNSSKPNAKRLSSRTVLFLSAPKEALDDQNLQRYFGDDAVRLWAATKAEKLESLVSSRNSKVEELESAEITLISKANKKLKRSWTKQNNRNANARDYNALSDNLKKSLRPKHRLTTPPVGKQVDSIDWLREQIKQNESDITKAREAYNTKEAHGAAAVFVEFRSLAAAQKAYQQVTSSELLAFTPRFTGVMPGEVIWDNLALPSARRISQEGVAHALVIALIAFWFIPVAFVAAVSNVSYLADNYKWLSFLKNLPDVVMGLLTGLVPPLLTSLLSKYVPNIFRCKHRSQPTSAKLTNDRHLQEIRRTNKHVSRIKGFKMVLCLPSHPRLLSHDTSFRIRSSNPSHCSPSSSRPHRYSDLTG